MRGAQLAIVVLTLTLGAIARSAPVHAQPLFFDLPLAWNLFDREAAIDPTIIRSRLVNIDWKLVKDAQNVTRTRGGGNEIVLNFFQDAVLRMNIHRGEAHSQRNFTWHGTIQGSRDSQVTLVVIDGVMVGNIRSSGRHFQIRHIANGVHAARQIDDSRFPPDGGPVPIALPGTAASTSPDQLSSDSAARFDIMVFYTSAARSAAGSPAAMTALINLAVAETNTAYSRSGVIPRVRLVYSAELVGYSENGNFSTELNRLQNPSDGFMDNVHALRNAFGGDMVALIIEGDGSLCGRGFLMQTESAAFESFAFSVTSRTCAAGNYTFGHELGHNMGLRHDRIDDNNNGVFPHSHGYVDATNNFRTIMGVASGCGGCPRIQNFSNPNVTHNGFPTGVPQASANSADAAASLNATAFTVANWRTQIAPVDFARAGKSDVVVFRGGAWLFHDFTTGMQSSGVWTGSASGCVPVAMDYDGDGKTDFTQFCGGAWHFYNSNGSYNKGIWTGGVMGDLPVPADYDGDGKDDVVIYRGGAWLFYDLTTGAFDAARSTWTGGGAGCVPVPMDYDRDWRADFTQLCNGAWHFYNADGSYNKGIWVGNVAGDIPVPGDYDGDGTEDLVVFRGGAWLFYDFATGAFNPGRSVWTGAPAHWTGGTTLPAPIDYDGDGKIDFTVFSGGPWHFYNANGSYNKGIWTGGVVGDRALSRKLLP